ncbi:hypothetical protein, partial [Mycolicibacterium gadium]|uniref:hypothetical protein n=1 Tax=Mycolicibacterium gadium TaxID=1794 RepID=UPI002FDCD51E
RFRAGDRHLNFYETRDNLPKPPETLYLNPDPGTAARVMLGRPRVSRSQKGLWPKRLGMQRGVDICGFD